MKLASTARAAPAKGSRVAINADLHAHSRVSDGVLAPEEVVRRAKRNGVELFALTDHDELAGLERARAEADRLDLAFVAGVEISVSWAGETVHVLGLNVDPGERALANGLARIREGRDGRAREIGERLAAAGFPGAFEGARQLAGNPDLVSRTHFARHLVARGACASVDQVFDRFLSPGLPGYVEHQWASLSEAVGWIRGAGGTAVLAHPGRYPFGDAALWALMEAFRDAGGEGIEVVCGSHRPDQYARFGRHAVELGLRGSRGSDFHSPDESGVDLGELPALPPNVEPVWEIWQ